MLNYSVAELRLYISFAILLIFSSCRNSGNKEILIKNLYGSYINIKTDSIEEISIDNLMRDKSICNEQFNVIVYSDSTKCSSCEVQSLYEWDNFVNELKRDKGIGLGLVYIFSPTKEGYLNLKNSIKNAKPSFPVLIDTIGWFAKNNPQISTNSLYHSFVINKQWKVVLVGNIMRNKNLTNLLLKEIVNKH